MWLQTKNAVLPDNKFNGNEYYSKVDVKLKKKNPVDYSKYNN